MQRRISHTPIGRLLTIIAAPAYGFSPERVPDSGYDWGNPDQGPYPLRRGILLKSNCSVTELEVSGPRAKM
jgi:hypothetical protein